MSAYADRRPVPDVDWLDTSHALVYYRGRVWRMEYEGVYSDCGQWLVFDTLNPFVFESVYAGQDPINWIQAQ
jgi:hypothetical protein